LILKEAPMHSIHPIKTGLAVSAVLALAHLIWASLVAVGWAGPVLEFILKLHFIEVSLKIAPFDLATAAALVALTGVIGFGIGAVFALLWNQLHAQRDANLSLRSSEL
jgi:hypothetical protein